MWMIRILKSTAAFPCPRSCCLTSSRWRYLIRVGMSLTATVILLGLCLTGCAGEEKSRGPEPGKVLSRVAQEACLLCGDGGAELFPWGQDNIGIFSLNTFNVTPIDINRYGQDGKPVKSASGTLRTYTGEEQETGCSTSLTVDTDRGMAIIDCALGKDEILDAKRAADVLCQSCLDRALSEDGTGVGIVDLATGEFRPLERAALGFGLGNYYVHCDWDDSQSWAKLWVFYTPLRYPPQ